MTRSAGRRAAARRTNLRRSAAGSPMPLHPWRGHRSQLGMRRWAAAVVARCHGALTTAATSSAGGHAATTSASVKPCLAYAEFCRRPTAVRAVLVFQQVTDADRAWHVFQTAINTGLRANVRFFQAMMSFCRRHAPEKAPDVLDRAVEHGVAICDQLFCTFIAACQRAPQALIRDALNRFATCGPRSHNVIFGVANLCRIANNPTAALFLVDEAVNRNVEFSDRLLSLFAALCAESTGHRSGAVVAQRLLHMVQSNRIPLHGNQASLANLVKALLVHQRFDLAVNALDRLESQGIPVSMPIYTHVLSALTRANRVFKAFALFTAMKERGIAVTAPVLTELIASCGRCFEIALVQTLHRYAHDDDMLQNDIVVGALICAYDRCGDIDAGERVFAGRTPSVPVVNSMIAAYGHHSRVEQARTTFEKLTTEARLVPTSRTLSALLVGCCQTGNVARAADLQSDFARRWNISLPDDLSGSTLADLYANAGKLDDAEEAAVRSSASSTMTSVMSWSYVLAGCRTHNDLPRAERALSTIRQLPHVPAHSLASAYVWLLHMHATAGNVDEYRRLRLDMERQGLLIDPGRTSVQQATCCSYYFSNDERFHGDEVLVDQHADLVQRLMAVGYTNPAVLAGAPSSQSVFLHSEIIALAYALNNVPGSGQIRLAKTVRVCPDCHVAIKAASSIYDRDVYVRDSSRHHYFHQGQCSCGDFW